MAHKEKYGIRDLGYSQWHRTLGKDVTATDIDFIEYCPDCFEPIAVFEIGYGLDNTEKVLNHNINAIRAVVRRLLVPTYVVLYEGEVRYQSKCPCCGRPFPRSKITAFRKKMLYPRESHWVDMSPEEYAQWLKSLRRQHKCQGGVRDADGR